MIHFAYKGYLFLLLLIPLLVWWNIFLNKQGQRFIFFSSRELVPDSGKTLKAFFIKHLNYIKLVSLVFLILALARPQLLNYYNVESKKGIDILITLDISGSMASIDFKPKNRLEVAKEVIADFIRKRNTDRIGLVVFAGASYTKCPLTIDYEMLDYFLKQTEIGELEDGTAIGMALASSVNRVRFAKTGTKVIILLTDGINNRGELDPRDAAVMARDFNIRVYTIGVGTKGKAPYPVKDSYGQVRYVLLDVEIDEQLLQEIANSTGGLYFRATDKDSLERIFTEIDRWEKTEVSSRRFHEAKELYPYFILAGLLILLVAELARRTVLRTLP